MKSLFRSSLLSAAFLSLAGGAPAFQYTATLAEMQSIRQAMEMFYIDYGFITTIENLDDILATEANPNHQAINHGGGALIIPIDTAIPERQFLTAPFPGGGPPYLTYSSGAPREGPDGDYDEGTPLDRFGHGNPYYLYSPLGLIEPKTEGTSLRFYGDSFHTFMIVSHGADGVPSADDIIVELPFTVSTLSISSARLQASPSKSSSPYQLVVRGYFFGESQGSGDLLFDGSPSGLTFTQWTGQQVTAALSQLPPEGTLVSLRTGTGATTRQIPITNELPPTSVESWFLYH